MKEYFSLNPKIIRQSQLNNPGKQDADLGYIKRYAEELHLFISSGRSLSGNAALYIKEAHLLMSKAYIDIQNSTKDDYEQPNYPPSPGHPGGRTI